MEVEFGYVECQVCGKPVEVMVPYKGCVTCDDCLEREAKYPSSWTIGHEDFNRQ